MMISTNMFLRTASRSSQVRSVSSVVRSSLRATPTAFAARNNTAPIATPVQKAFFSDGSHDDFASKKKVEVTDQSEAAKVIQDHISSNAIMLYMKGNPGQPQCGFSAKVVQALQDEGSDFSSVNVLDYPAIREGVKQFSEWPTIPQLYVNGEFIGGCDIILQMHESGELKELLKEIK